MPRPWLASWTRIDGRPPGEKARGLIDAGPNTTPPFVAAQLPAHELVARLDTAIGQLASAGRGALFDGATHLILRSDGRRERSRPGEGRSSVVAPTTDAVR